MFSLLNDLYEGVDTLSVKLTNNFLNYELLQEIAFSRVQHINQVTYVHIVCNGLSISRSECLIKNTESTIYHYYLDIQADYIYSKMLFDRELKSCYEVVYLALFELVRRKIIVIPDMFKVPEKYAGRWSNITDRRALKLAFHLKKLCKLTELDFFFDFDSWDDVRPFVTAKRVGKTTFYSIDHGDFKSQLIIYDRRERLKSTNHFSEEEIQKVKPVRLEFRLNIKTCSYLDLQFLYGDLHDLIFRYSPVLIKSWKKYCIAFVKKDLNHPWFDYIQVASECGQTPKIGNELRKGFLHS